MHDLIPSCDTLQLVRFTLACVARGHRRILDTSRVLINERTSGRAFANQVIADYVAASGGQPLSTAEKKGLRVSCEVLKRWPKGSVGRKKQVDRLEEIRDALVASHAAVQGASVPLPSPSPPAPDGLFDVATFDSADPFH